MADNKQTALVKVSPIKVEVRRVQRVPKLDDETAERCQNCKNDPQRRDAYESMRIFYQKILGLNLDDLL